MHELTEKIVRVVTGIKWPIGGRMVDSIDSIITDWLREKAKYLSAYKDGPLPAEIYKDLDLTEDSKMKNKCEQGPIGTVFEATAKVAKKDYDLDEPKPHQAWCAASMSLNLACSCKPKESPVSGEWCEHIKYQPSPNPYYHKSHWWYTPKDDNSNGWYVDDRFEFCPHCATPRPSKPSLRDELGKILRDKFTGTKNSWEDVADIALDFLKSRKGEL